MNWLYSLFFRTFGNASRYCRIFNIRHRIGIRENPYSRHFLRCDIRLFFIGIMAGHLGITVDPQMLNYAESFGLIVFVYALQACKSVRVFSDYSEKEELLSMSRSGCRVHWYYHDGNSFSNT